MQIAPYERVVYENNPLAEVVCQIRFERTELSESAVNAIQTQLAERYPNAYTEDCAEISVSTFSAGSHEVRKETALRLFHHASPDHAYRLSFSNEFIAVTCSRYESWTHFKPVFFKAADVFCKVVGAQKTTRVGLRYKDVIEREPLGLEGVPWRELLAGFVLGPLSASELTLDGTVPEDDVESFAFQSNIRLEDCKLLLQGGLLFSIDAARKAFLVDSDFFLDQDVSGALLSDQGQLDHTLERLHNNAGALFGRAMKERLRVALKPK